MKDGPIRWVIVLLVITLAAGGVTPARARLLVQEDQDMVDFDKPDWGMTMQYPFDWTAEDLGDVLRFTAEDYSSFSIIQGEAFTDMKRSLSGLTQIALNRLGVNTIGLNVRPQKGTAGRREALVSGVEATYYVGWVGYLIQFVVNGAGYVILCTAVADTFGARQTVFSAMAESIQFEGLETPTPTPRKPTATPRRSTPTPRKPTATPAPRAATPTPEPERQPTTPPRIATPAPHATPSVEATTASHVALTSAREAYDLAWPEVETWSVDAILDWAECEATVDRQDADARPGACGRWQLVFLKDATAADITIADVGPDSEDNAYSVIVTDGAVNADESEKWVVWKAGATGSHTGSAGPDWVDSDVAVQAFRDAGGAVFELMQDEQLTGKLWLHRPAPDAPLVWSVSAADTSVPGEKLELRTEVDAATGTVDTTAWELPAYRKTLTLREAVAAAQPAAEEWRVGAKLTEANAEVGPNDDGAEDGKAGRWTLTYMAEGQHPGDLPEFNRIDVADGKVAPGTSTGFFNGSALPVDWPDSGEVWARLRDSDAFSLIGNHYPKGTRSFDLKGTSDGAFQWTVQFEAGDVRLSLEFRLGTELTTSDSRAIPTRVTTATRPTQTATRTARAGRSTRTPTPEVVEESTPETAEPTPERQDVLFQDDFSGDGGYLGTYQAEDGEGAYTDGVYRMSITKAGSYIFGSMGEEEHESAPQRAFPDSGDLVDISVDVDVETITDPPRSWFGVACGWHSPEDFYGVWIGTDGRTFQILQAQPLEIRQPGEDLKVRFQFLAGQGRGDPQPAVHTGPGAHNHVRAVCARNGFSIEVNGEKLVEYPIQSSLRGGIALFADASEAGLEVEFDNLVVRRLAEAPEFALPEPEQAVFTDDFSDETGGWFVGATDEDSPSARYSEGAYEVSLPSAVGFAYRPSFVTYGDISAEVDVTQLDGARVCGAGLVCRMWSGQVLYLGAINMYGEYAILRLDWPSERWERIADWSKSFSIRTGMNKTNHLRFDCVGDTLTLSINGKQERQVRAAGSDWGYAGVGGLSYQDTEASVFSFDNYVLRTP